MVSPAEAPQEGVPQEGRQYHCIRHLRHGRDLHHHGRVACHALRAGESGFRRGVMDRGRCTGEHSVGASLQLLRERVHQHRHGHLADRLDSALPGGCQRDPGEQDGCGCGCSVTRRTADLRQSVPLQQEAVDAARGGECDLVADRVLFPAVHGHPRFEYPC